MPPKWYTGVMDIGLENADRFLASLVAQPLQDTSALHQALESLDAPIYVTDAEGFVTFYNKACIGFTGRQPAVGKDRWCVTWKLYTVEGAYLPHDECPMALAIKTGESVRGLTAFAVRPDGTRVHFLPFPTPLRDPKGELIGAINILIDITDARQVTELLAQAERCRRLADATGDDRARSALSRMSAEYAAKATEMQKIFSGLLDRKA
jgi:PAS domain S-box-containing protein